MIYNQFELPKQRRPESQWTKKLYIEHANRMIQFLGTKAFHQRNETISDLYRTYSCEKTKKENEADKTITEQYGYELGVDFMVYPLAEMVVDQLVGEYLSLPLRKKTYSINKAAINKRLDEKVKYISEDILRAENKKLEGQLGFKVDTENPEVDLPDNIEVFFSKEYKTLSEELSDDIIVHFLDVKKESRKIKTLLQDFLISEQATGFIDEKDGHPTLVRTRYDETYNDMNPDEEVQTDINIFAHSPYMTLNEILNKYDLKEEEITKVEDVFTSLSSGKLIEDNFSYGKNSTGSAFQNCENGTSYQNWYEGSATHRLRTVKMLWRSRKEIRAKVHINKVTGEKEYTLLKPTDKVRKRDRVEKTTFEVIRYVDMLGPEICLGYGEYKQRLSFIDNKKKVRLPVIHLRGRNTMYSGEIRSVVAKVKPLQDLASQILFELRLAIKANNGRILVYDTSQIPKQFLDTYGKENAINRMLHHIKKDKILLFNSKDKQSRATFNQFTALDLTNKGQTQDLINALMLIEDLARKFVGISKERQGEVDQYQTKGGTDTAVRQSNARTEIYFNPFDEFVQSILDRTLAKSKHIYKAGQVFSYVFGDLMTKFLTIYGEYFNDDIGVYLGNRFKDKRDKDIIDQAAVQALGNATEKELILDLINVLQGDSASESKAILEKGLASLQKMQAESAKAAQEAEQAKQQHEQVLQDKKDQVVRDGHAKDIEVAHIYADNKAFTENEKNQSQELQTAAKLALEAEKSQKEKEKPTPAKAEK